MRGSDEKTWNVELPFYSGLDVYSELYMDDFVQDYSISSVLAMEILQSCTKPSIWGMSVVQDE